MPKAGTVSVETQTHDTVPGRAARHKLHDMARDWHYFNHGALLTFAGLQYDPLADWYAQQPAGVVVMRQLFRQPVFSGLHAPTAAGLTWDHAICGVQRVHWQSVFEFLGGIAVTAKDAFYSTFSGDVTIADPSCIVAAAAAAPVITVTVFCVDGSDARWEVVAGLSPYDRPAFVRKPPRADTIAMVRALRTGDIEQVQHVYNPAMQPFRDEFNDYVTGRRVRRRSDES